MGVQIFLFVPEDFFLGILIFYISFLSASVCQLFCGFSDVTDVITVVHPSPSTCIKKLTIT